MAFDHTRRGGPPPFRPICDPRALDGVALPPELFVADPALRGEFFCSEPVEEAFFTALPAAEAVRVCAALAPGVEPRRRVVTDRYVDTPELALFHRGISARVREYHLNTRPVYFEVVVLALDRPAPLVRPAARVNRVLVQTFVRNDAAGLEALLARQARAGLVEVARVDKTRTAFDILPVVGATVGGVAFHGADTRLVEDLASLRIVDLGVKVVVDEFHGAGFDEPAIVEVEYDLARAEEGAALVERLRAALGAEIRPKARNKIAYLLAGSSPPLTETLQEERG
jgi:hypothetical protein